MTKHEYYNLCQAIRSFMADDSGGWQNGMDILASMKESHERRQLRHLQPGYFEAVDAAGGGDVK